MLNLINKKFGKLKVVNFIGLKQRADGRKNSWWKCVCDCGREKDILGVALTRKKGPSRSCGCMIGITHGLSYTAEYLLWQSAKKRAKDGNLNFTILPKDIVIPKKCPLLDLPLQANVSKPGANSPSVDRLDSNKGYTPDNIWVISYKANSVKNNLTLPELKLLVKNLELKIIGD